MIVHVCGDFESREVFWESKLRESLEKVPCCLAFTTLTRRETRRHGIAPSFGCLELSTLHITAESLNGDRAPSTGSRSLFFAEKSYQKRRDEMLVDPGDCLCHHSCIVPL